MYDELLKYVDDVDVATIDAEISVIESLIDSYEKSLMILESYTGDDISAFAIFQEGEKWDKFKEDTNAPILGNEGESVGKRIAMVIPRLIAALVRLCKNLFSRNKSITRRMKSDVDNMRSTIQTGDPEKIRNDLRENAQKTQNDNGDVILSINSILFGHYTDGSIDRIFLKKDWFAECQTELSKAFENGSDNVTGQQKHLDTITSWVKSIMRACNDLQVRSHSGGEPIQIKDSEFVEKMDEFEKLNNGDIDACNQLIAFVGEKINSLNSTKNTEDDADRNQFLTKLLRQYNRFLKMLNTYVTAIWEAWEHDRGARDQARRSAS